MKRKNSLWIAIALLSFGAVGATQTARTIHLTDRDMAHIRLRAGRTTVLSFPLKPSKVILGNQGAFAIEYVESDLAIAPLQPRARTNLYVYVEGRRFSFDLEATDGTPDEIILVRDALTRKRIVKPK